MQTIKDIHKGWVNIILVISETKIATGSNDAFIKIWNYDHFLFNKTSVINIL